MGSPGQLHRTEALIEDAALCPNLKGVAQCYVALVATPVGVNGGARGVARYRGRGSNPRTAVGTIFQFNFGRVPGAARRRDLTASGAAGGTLRSSMEEPRGMVVGYTQIL